MSEHSSETTVLCAEFFYALPAENSRARGQMMTHFAARCAALHPGDAVLVLAGDAALYPALDAVLIDFPHLTVRRQVVRPTRTADGSYAQTDRWARIDAALQAAATPGAVSLLMPALDAVYDRRLIERLLAVEGPASAWTPCHHAGTGIIAAAMNAAFNRDRGFKRRLKTGHTQQFWGKVGMIPGGLCAALRTAVQGDHRVWEDDMAIDRALNALGHPARCLWITDPAVYHLHPPVLTQDDLDRVIDRHLHYALHGGSGLLLPPDRAQRRRMAHDADYAAAVMLADERIARAQAALTTRLTTHGESAVIWGGYTITARPGDPFVRIADVVTRTTP